MALKVVINDPKTGKSFQKEIPDEQRDGFLGLKIGEAIQGDVL